VPILKVATLITIGEKCDGRTRSSGRKVRRFHRGLGAVQGSSISYWKRLTQTVCRIGSRKLLFFCLDCWLPVVINVFCTQRGKVGPNTIISARRELRIMNCLIKSMLLARVATTAGVFILLFSSVVLGQEPTANQGSQCNAPAAAPVSYVSLPGHPFSTISSKDGCWLFVSLTSANPKSANGVALLSRSKGQITLKKVFPVEAGPTGMALTHDGKLLIVADDDYVVFMDVTRMITEKVIRSSATSVMETSLGAFMST
jgi:hypothetical protein